MLKIEVLFGSCFLVISSLYIAAHPIVFAFLDSSVKMCKCAGYLFLTFSISSWKILEMSFYFMEFAEG